MNAELRNLLWIEELLPDEIVAKRMQGGIGYYLDQKFVLLLVERSKTREHKGVSYPFEIWNGCLFPVQKMKQNTVWAKFPFLENHPAKKDCLYLPADSQDFEDEVKAVLREIKKRSPLFGTFLKVSHTTGRASPENEDDEVNTSKPRLFNTDMIPRKPAPVAQSNKKKAVVKASPSAKKKLSKKSENDLLLSVLKRQRT